MVLPPLETTRQSLQHIIIIWMVLLVLLIGGFAVAVITLNATVFSAGGFVSSYLGALQRHDLGEALGTPGVLRTASARDELLTPEALGGIDEVSIVSDVAQGSGVHEVTYTATLGTRTVRGVFEVQKEEPRFGAFSTWSFLRSPTAALRITPLHDASFTVNGVGVTAPDGPGLAETYQVLTPGFFTLAHDSRYLVADPVTTSVAAPGSIVPVTLDIRASKDFVSAIQEQVDAFLEECTQQHVLFPTGCPFGQELSNRVASTPEWSLARYPQITIVPGNDRGTWVIPDAEGAAHLTVQVRSLFDGTISTFDEDVPFTVGWVMTITDGRVDIRQG